MKRSADRARLRTWIGGAAVMAMAAPLLSVRAATPLSIRHQAVDCVVPR